MIMVKAGRAVDMVVESLLPFLDKGDIIIDGGNSLYTDTIRREQELAEQGIHFFGCGVSGGEEGALHGPSLMPGGNKAVWEDLKPIFESIAAKDFDGGPCVTYLSPNGAGHYVKMVHNGIEYAIMQMIAESYQLLKDGYGLTAPEIADVFERFQQGRLESFLFEISVPVLRKRDDQDTQPGSGANPELASLSGVRGSTEERSKPYNNTASSTGSGDKEIRQNSDDQYLLEKVLDKAGQKGTGRWTAVESFKLGAESSTIAAAVNARVSSSMKSQRIKYSEIYGTNQRDNFLQIEQFIPKLEQSLYAAILVAYAQGFDLIAKAADEYDWDINFSEVARIWEGGCIIRAKVLKTMSEAFKAHPNKPLLMIPSLAEEIKDAWNDWRKVVGSGVKIGVPLFCLGGALTSFESLVSERTSANMIQGLRDCFGAHTYERIDLEGVFHTEW